MIQGYLRLTPSNQPIPPIPLNFPIWYIFPWVDAVIKIPSLAVESTVPMLADTGATGTALSVKDAMPILGKTLGQAILLLFCLL